MAFDRRNAPTILLILAPYLIHLSVQHNILMIPNTINSHLIYFSRLGQELSELGHQIEILVPAHVKLLDIYSTANLTVTKYPLVEKLAKFNTREMSEKVLKYAKGEKGFLDFWEINKQLKDILRIVDEECRSLMNNKVLLDRLVNRSNFKFVILDVGSNDCFVLIAKMMKVMYANLAIPIQPMFLGNPRLPSFVPNTAMRQSERMNFYKRLTTFLWEIFFNIIFQHLSRPNFIEELGFDNQIYKQETQLEVLKNAALYFYLEDPTLGYPKPYMPDTICVGDLIVGYPENSLPEEFSNFMGKSDVILISFGSYIDYFDNATSEKFCRTITNLPEIKFIWRSKIPATCADHLDNLLIRSWIPQNDLLADSRLKLFITHGGFNSMLESIYHATPVIVFPLIADQTNLASVATEKKYGIEMDLGDWEWNDLVENIRQILFNNTYKDSITKASNIIRDRKTRAAERVSQAIDHVLKFGADHLKSSAGQLHWFQFLMFDIFLFLLFMFIIFTCFFIFIWYKVGRFIQCRLLLILKNKKE